MKVDQEFVDAVMATTEGRYPHEIIEATLAVAAERGMVVGEWAVWRDGILLDGGNLLLWMAVDGPVKGGRRVRVAIVEIKE